MSKMLAGLTILNTRPKELANELTSFVQNHGGSCLSCPAIDIIPFDNHWEKAIPTHCDWVIFISQNAVKHSISSLKKSWTSFPKAVSIGKKTTDLLNSNQVRVSVTAEKTNSESLLTATPFQTLENKTIVLIKGQGGRRFLQDTLTARGANLISLDVYKRRCPNTLPSSCKNIWKNNKRFIILGTSVDSINNLFILFGPKATTWLQKTPWLVISERIKQHATSLGIKTAYVSEPNELCETLLTLNIKGSNDE